MSQNEIDLKYLIETIRKKKKFILFGTLSCVIVAVITSFFLPAVYQASLLLEVGKIYSPFGQPQSEPTFIEAPESIVMEIKSDNILDQIRQKLQLDVSLKSLHGRLNIETFSFKGIGTEYSPFINITYRGSSSRQVVDFLNSLSLIIAEQHAEKFMIIQESFNSRIKYIRDKIVASERIISAQTQYLAESQKYINKGEKSADEFTNEMNKLETSSSSPTDILFLQSSSLVEKQNITELTMFKSTTNLSVGQNQKEIAEDNIEIVSLESRLKLSWPTRVRNPAVLPEYPVGPKKKLIVIITAGLGLFFTTMYALAREYLKD